MSRAAPTFLRRLSAAVVAGACLVAPVACGGDDDEQRALPPAFVGIVAEDVIAGEGDYRERMLDRQQAAGVELIRQTFHWDRVETAPGRFDFGYYDDYVAIVARHRIRVLPILFSPPGFRSSEPETGAARGTYPPEHYEDMAAFARALVERYGTDGTFWKDNPGLPELPITAWQIWNEPNLPVYWPPRPDAAEYVRLLSTVGRAIKRADPRAQVVSAGLSESRLGVPFRRYVSSMYRNGAGRLLDVFALHAFSQDVPGVVAAVEQTRALVRKLGTDSPIWITEFGWASGGPPSPFTVDEAEQARRVRESLRILIERREELNLRGLVYYNWRDSDVYPGGRDFFGLHAGLLDRQGRNKPALRGFRSVTARFR